MGLRCQHVHAVGKYNPREIVSKTATLVDWRGAEIQVAKRLKKTKKIFRRLVNRIKRLITNDQYKQVFESGDPAAIVDLFESMNIGVPKYPGYEPVAITKASPGALRIYTEIGDELLNDLVSMGMASGSKTWKNMKNGPMPVLIEGQFTILNPYVVPELQQRVGWLLEEVRTGINASIRTEVAAIAQETYEQRLGWEEARDRIQQTVGLRTDQVETVNKIRSRLVEQGMTGRTLERRIKAESLLRLEQRAELIARTELRNAQALGRHAAWSDAQDKGFFGGRTVLVRWVAGITDRTCPICADLNGMTVVLRQPFESSQDLPKSLQVQGTNPPIHPNCRCTTVLEIPDA
jgi:hypothetical protein